MQHIDLQQLKSLPSFRIRPAKVEDIRPALWLKLQAWWETFGTLRSDEFYANHEANLESEAQWWERGMEAGAEFVVAENPEGTMMGLAGATPSLPEDADTGVDIEVGMLYVLKEHGGDLLKMQLLETILHGRDALVWVLAEVPTEQTFYEAQGFKADGTREPLTGSWEGLTDMRMVRRTPHDAS